MLSTWGIEFARRAFFVVAPIAKPTKTSPIHRMAEVAMTRTIPAALPRPDKIRKMSEKITGRNENRLMTTRSIGSRRSGRASNSPMYSASRIFALNRSPHDLDESLFEARRLERHLALLAEPALDDRQDLFVRLRDEDFPFGTVSRRRLHDHAHPNARISLRLVDGPEERGASLVHDQQMVREHLGLVQVVRRQEDCGAALRHVAKHRPHVPPAEGIEPDRRLVEEEDLGVGDHRHRDDHALPQAARELGVELGAVLPEAKVVHHLPRPVSGVLARATSDEAHVVEDRKSTRLNSSHV